MRLRLALEDLGVATHECVAVIWGHGLKWEDAILDELERGGSTIHFIQRFRFRRVNNFVSKVYRYDTTPRRHIMAKTAYLRSVPHEALVVAMTTSAPRNEIKGSGFFRHPESEKMRQVKWSIRRTFNPDAGEEETTNHVIHITDSSAQARALSRMLGMRSHSDYPLTDSSDWTLRTPNFPLTLHTKEVRTRDLQAGQLQGSRWEYRVVLEPIFGTIQWGALAGNWKPYESYVQKFRGTGLRRRYSKQRFLRLVQATQEDCLPPPVVCWAAGKFRILDGLHRVVAWASAGQDVITVRELRHG